MVVMVHDIVLYRIPAGVHLPDHTGDTDRNQQAGRQREAPRGGTAGGSMIRVIKVPWNGFEPCQQRGWSLQRQGALEPVLKALRLLGGIAKVGRGTSYNFV